MIIIICLSLSLESNYVIVKDNIYIYIHTLGCIYIYTEKIRYMTHPQSMESMEFFNPTSRSFAETMGGFVEYTKRYDATFQVSEMFS